MMELSRISKLSKIILVLVLGSLLTCAVSASSYNPNSDGLTEDARSLIKQNEAWNVVYLLRVHDVGMPRYGHVLQLDRSLILESCIQMIEDHKGVDEWKAHPFRGYVERAFTEIIGHEFEQKHDLTMTYIRNDLRSPAMAVLLDSHFYEGDIELIEDCIAYLLSAMPDMPSRDEGMSMTYAATIMAAVEVLMDVDTKRSNDLARSSIGKLLSKWDTNEVDIIKNEILRVADLRHPNRNNSFLLSSAAIIEVGHAPSDFKEPTSSPAATEFTEELATLKRTVEGHTESAPVEIAEEAPEESSQWWLWLTGALIILGGLALVVCRKN